MTDPQNKILSLPPDLCNAIAHGFGIKLYSAEQCRGVWRLGTSDGFKYLKRSKLEAPDLHFIYEALEYLIFQNFHHVPRLALSRMGEPFVTHQNHHYLLTNWYFSQELDFGVTNDLKEAARFLARFHLAGQGFIPCREHYWRTCWFGWPVKLENRLGQLQEFRKIALMEKERSTFSRLYLSFFDSYFHQAEACLNALLNSSYYEVALIDSKIKSLCHHDFSSRNLLRSTERQIILVDFDYCLRDLRIHDLINLLIRNLKHHDWDPAICRLILKEYHQIRKLTPEEIQVMYVILGWPQEFWQVGLQYYFEKLPWPSERFLKKLQSKIQAQLLWERFLEEFPKNNGIYSLKR